MFLFNIGENCNILGANLSSVSQQWACACVHHTFVRNVTKDESFCPYVI